MNDIISFLNSYYKIALKLVSDFDITKNKKWDSKDYLNELYVQLGHVYNVLLSDKNVNEKQRKIDNLGDELSDVLLQIINLARTLNIDMYEIKSLEGYSYNNINGISILLGQLTEAVMEINECRFKKDRSGFDSSYDFVKDRLFKLFIITYNISYKYNLNMNEEFGKMVKDANGFLKRFKTGKRKAKEYIDIYDSNERLLGYCEKDKAHKLGYWHRVFGCLIYNSKNKTVFFQLKNPKHNNIHTKELLEITAGGHLITGETLQNGIREIKEETGFDVDYNDLHFIEKRRCNEKITKDYTIKEFQYFYGLDLDIKLTDFKDFDDKEVVSFIKIKINDAIKLLKGKKNSIKGTKLVDNRKINIRLSILDFDKAFIQNGLYLSLLENIKEYGGKKKMNRKLKKLYKITNMQKKQKPEKFYFDDGKVCNSKDFNKEDFKYSVLLVNTNRNTDNYLVYLLAIYSNKSTPQLLLKEFSNKKGTKKYFNDLCDFVENNNNRVIINRCYKEKMKDFNKISFIKKIHYYANILN